MTDVRQTPIGGLPPGGDRATRWSRHPIVACVLLGVGLGGFVDGIVLHQVLQWHHMLTATGDHPADTVAGLEANTLADGLFHAATWVFAVADPLWWNLGFLAFGAALAVTGILLVRRGRRSAGPAGPGRDGDGLDRDA